jgi:hypothetical protein
MSKKAAKVVLAYVTLMLLGSDVLTFAVHWAALESLPLQQGMPASATQLPKSAPIQTSLKPRREAGGACNEASKKIALAGVLTATTFAVICAATCLAVRIGESRS